jgi:flagellar basal-body rod protein FlgF
MDNGIYVALARQVTLFQDMDVTANNLANANTTGYTAEHILFGSYLAPDNSYGDENKVAYPNNLATYRNTENGSLTSTGNQLDVAIEGNGYFMVDTPLGKRYTRAGNFQVSPDGTLSTVEGYPVLDTSGGKIELPENTTSIEVGSAGNLKFNGNDSGSLAVVQFANPQLLERISGKLFKSDITPQPATDFQVLQGVVESSNVQPLKELTHMTAVSHSVADTAQLISVIYDLEDKANTAWSQQ